MKRPLNYCLHKQKATLGKLKGQIVQFAMPCMRERVDHREFCEEVARATTFTGAEVEAVLRLAAEIVKRHVENGDSVDYGDIGTFLPSFKGVQILETETFDAKKHILKPKMVLRPSQKYFCLEGVSFERTEAPAKKKKPSGGSSSGTSGASGI